MLSVVNVAFKMALSVHDIFKHNIKNSWLPVNGVAWLLPGQRSVTPSEVQDPLSISESHVPLHIPVSLPLASARAELNLQTTVTKPL